MAEYMSTTVKCENGLPEPSFDGFYLMASYFLTDDERPYDADDAEFAGIIPQGEYGALEMALRYSTLDLNDSDGGVNFDGGESVSYTLALNWYINNNFQLKTNYIHTKYDDKSDGDGNDYAAEDKVDILGVRMQYLF